MVFLTFNNFAKIMMQQRKNGNRIDIQWSYETSSIKFAEVGEDLTSLNIGFVNQNLNVQFDDPILAQRFNQKMQKIINHFK